MNAEEKLRERVVRALRATDSYALRGPKTLAVRTSLTTWLSGSVYREPGYVGMIGPAGACRWLEYVVTVERARARLEADQRKAREAEETS